MAEINRRVIQGLIAAGGLTLAQPALTQSTSTPAQQSAEKTEFKPALPDGRRIALHCFGSGAPTVIADAGLGGSTTQNHAWLGIAEQVKKVTRICLFDRPGRGGSDPADGVRTSADVAADLHGALKSTDLQGPFVLAGHSLGGINMRVFAGRYPEDAAALVLVDSSHPDQVASWTRVFPPAAPGEAAAVTTARARLAAMTADSANNPERIDLMKSADQARAVRSLGDMPLVILTHSPKWRMVPSLPDAVLALLEAETQRLQREQLGLSPNARQIVAEEAGHDLPTEDPALVVLGIRQAIEAVRARDCLRVPGGRACKKN